MTLQLIINAMKHGHHCWSELHFYYGNHSLGTWREWLCN